MNVCFFRHGPAVEPGTPGIPDDARPLTPDGRRRTRAAARGLASLRLGLDGILSSPLPRALQTAEILAKALGLPRPRTSELLLPGSPAERLLGAIREAGGEAPVLVGHEPSLSAAVSLLAGAPRPLALQLKKAGMAFAAVDALKPRPRGTLLLLLTPAVLRGLAR
ncbi:MAG: histidine phosphatase family protein [Planctomycetia bacterium]|nr:histidine phosphatase family protein [Planctomycetia bacterium]